MTANKIQKPIMYGLVHIETWLKKRLNKLATRKRDSYFNLGSRFGWDFCDDQIGEADDEDKLAKEAQADPTAVLRRFVGWFFSKADADPSAEIAEIVDLIPLQHRFEFLCGIIAGMLAEFEHGHWHALARRRIAAPGEAEGGVGMTPAEADRAIKDVQACQTLAELMAVMKKRNRELAKGKLGTCEPDCRYLTAMTEKISAFCAEMERASA